MTRKFAVDLGGTKIAAARIEEGRIADRRQTATDGTAGFDAQIAAMAGLLAQLGHAPGDRLGVVVAGRVDTGGRWQAVNADTLPGIGGEPLLDRLRTHFGGDITVGNDAAATALAEARLGAGIGADHFAYLTVSTGVGGGIVLGDRLLASKNGLAGHVGFVSSSLGNAICGSGRWGTVESIAAGRAIAAAAHTLDAKAAFAADTNAARDAIDRSAAAIARLCADLTSVLGLDRVAIGGGVGLAGGYLERVRSHLATEPPLFRVEVVAAELGHDGALLGALLSADV